MRICVFGSGKAGHIASGHAMQIFNDLHYSLTFRNKLFLMFLMQVY
jgi:D-arabinose 5-phosphate isomerase GutQ